MDSDIPYTVHPNPENPERRVYYLDVGEMPVEKVKQLLEQVHTEVQAKKLFTN